MQNENMNPISMLNSLMSGNIENTPLQKLITNIQQKVETKINNGEIDKEKLEHQAKDILNNTSFNSINSLNSLNSFNSPFDLFNKI